MRGLLTEGRLLMAMLTTGTLAPVPGRRRGRHDRLVSVYVAGRREDV